MAVEWPHPMSEVERNPSVAPEVSRLLEAWSAGEPGALDRLTAAVAGELRTIARRQLRREGERPSLQPTELVHEAFLRLLDQRTAWQNRAHFLGVASHLMRRILVDRARRRRAAKRPRADLRVSLVGLAIPDGGQDVSVLDLHRALEELAVLDPRAARVVELRSFGGCSVPEASEVLGVSEATVARDWRMALTWLRRALATEGPDRDGSEVPA